ncbi:MAG: GMC family oxidoreductase, partial [Acidobacteriaceae bacterium]|nr:GMC family oxidoreductase [Acidobacteriaceae bacterium]
MQKFDVIIAGSGACGGWACMALAQNGFKVALVEAGSHIEPFRDFHHQWPYQLPFRGAGQPGYLRRYHRGATEYNYRIMIDDADNPYTTPPDKPFRWLRSRVLGGRTLHWSRASDRFSDLEFKAASRDGYGEDWPISYADIAPYYDRVERFIGVSAAPANLPQFPDGVFLAPMPLNCAETIFSAAAQKIGFPATPRRVAQLTRTWNNRPPCHYCGNCVNGCDVGAMFSTVSTTLPPALKTGNVTLLCDSVVSHVLMNKENRASGVRYVERYTNRSVEIGASVVVLAGSSLENTRLLLNSANGGLANSSGVLGKYLMDQIGGADVTGFLPPLKDTPIRNDDGKAGGLYIPNFTNIGPKPGSSGFIRGYGMSASGGAALFPAFAPGLAGFGSSYKKQVKLLYPAAARVWLSGGEMLSRKENFVELDANVRDKWDIPVLKITCTHSDNDRRLYNDFFARAQELFRAAG